METIELSGRTGQEVYEELKHRLEGMGYLPDEYFLLDADWEDRRVIPRNADLFCTTDYGDSEGIYLDVYLKWYGEDGKPVIKSFATGKTLGESGSDMDRMFLISSAITKAFHGEQGAYARYRQMEDSTKAEGVVLHLSPKEQRVLMDALLEQRMRQEAQMTNTEQLLRRMTGSITAYKEMMEYIQSQLSQIGIDATVNVIDSSTYSEMSKAGELGANFMTHGMSNLNAYHFLDIYMSSEGSYNKSQHLAYSNPHVDELLAEMKTTLDDDRFHELAVELQEIANTELPVIPLFYDTSNLIYNQEQITGYEDFSDHLDLSHLSWVNAQ